MYNPDKEPDIFSDGADRLQESDTFQEAQNDLVALDDSEFLYHYKATKQQYSTLVSAIKELQKASDALSDMGALAIDPEIGENTTLLIEDYTRLLEQMHMASYWEREGR
jgi:hypothetical protein